MKPYFSLSIPEPCHEDWSKMTPNDRGRYCQSCSKTVIDFTTMNVEEIQDYIHNHRNQRICGHIKQSQLDSINLKIPETIFNQELSFNRLFLLVLLICMGSTLFNCKDTSGVTKKIERIEIVETSPQIKDTVQHHSEKQVLDSVPLSDKNIPKPKIQEQLVIDGLMIIGEVPIQETETVQDSTKTKDTTQCLKGEDEDDILFGMIVPSHIAEFQNTPKHLSKSEKRIYFSEQIDSIVTRNFNENLVFDLDLKGRQRVLVRFTIDKNGVITEIIARGPHRDLEEEAIRVIRLLPKLKPAEERGRKIESTYSLPIIIQGKD